jgi:polysaccharide biosynthesis/export protein
MKIFFQTILLAVILVSCSTQRRIDHNFTYFQKGLDSIGQLALKEPVIKPNDLVSIQVFSNSLDQTQANIYNTANGIQANNANSAQTGATVGFLVDEEGNIAYPTFGKLHIAGFTLKQLNDTLRNLLSDYVKEPSLNVRFLNYKINVLGEVRSPGSKSFLNQRVTILDALSVSGDLSDQGRRDNILVMREENGTIKTYQVDLRKADFFTSPAYQLQQNDIVYVSPNEVKLKSVKRNPNIDRDLQLTLGFLSLFSVFLTLYNASK